MVDQDQVLKPHTYQVAIMAREPAQAAWSARCKSVRGVDPVRGFAFGWRTVKGVHVGAYSLHLKSNAVTRRNKEEARNIRKREVAAALASPGPIISVEAP